MSELTSFDDYQRVKRVPASRKPKVSGFEALKRLKTKQTQSIIEAWKKKEKEQAFKDQIFKHAFNELYDVKIIHSGKEYSAMELFFEKLIDPEILFPLSDEFRPGTGDLILQKVQAFAKVKQLFFHLKDFEPLSEKEVDPL